MNRLWVLSPTHLQANVVVAPNAVLGASEFSVVSGFQVVTQPFAFQTQAANPSLPSIGLPIVNAVPTQQTLYPGAFAAIYGSNLALSPTAAQVTLNNVPVPDPVRLGGPDQFRDSRRFSDGPSHPEPE